MERETRKEGEWEIQQWEQQSETNPVEEPPLQSDEHRCFTHSLLLLHRCVFPLLPSLLHLHYSSVHWESPAHDLSCCSSRSIESAGSPKLAPHFQRALSTFHPQAWRLRAGPFMQLRGRVSHHRAALFAAKKKKRQEERRGIFRWWKNPLYRPLFPVGLQFWLSVGTKQRGPKCLKPITCCQCLGVTLRCVAFTYIACWDTALVSLYLNVLCRY